MDEVINIIKEKIRNAENDLQRINAFRFDAQREYIVGQIEAYTDVLTLLGGTNEATRVEDTR